MAWLRGLDRFNQTLMVLAAFWGFILAVTITIDVTGRGLFNQPLVGTVEIITNSVVVMVFLQVCYAVRSRSMLRADFLVNVVPGWLQRIFNIICYGTGAFIFGLVAYGCIEPLIRAYERGEFEGEGALRVPTWPIYSVIIAGSLLATMNYLVLLALEFRNRPPAA